MSALRSEEDTIMEPVIFLAMIIGKAMPGMKPCRYSKEEEAAAPGGML